MSKIIKNAVFLLLITTFIVLISILILGFFGINRYVVVSGSMEPIMYAGDIAIVDENFKFEEIEIGDIIIFKYKDMNVIHRVVDKTMINGEMYFKTKGDANKKDDGYLTNATNYCGKNLFLIPNPFGLMINFKN